MDTVHSMFSDTVILAVLMGLVMAEFQERCEPIFCSNSLLVRGCYQFSQSVNIIRVQSDNIVL